MHPNRCSSSSLPRNQVNNDQSAVVTATVVANANSGDNHEVDNANQAGAPQATTNILTGDASAIGSQDANVVTQGADITVHPEPC